MIQQQTQLLEFYRASMRSAADIAKASLENAEKLQNRQMQLVRSALEENTRSAAQLAEVRSLPEMMALQARLAGSQIEQAVEFWSSVWRTAGDNQAALAQQVQSVVGTVREATNQARHERKSA